MEELNPKIKSDLLAQYREMAQDEQRETEAREWSEGLITDIADQES
jgi:hypothetical protein